jgi:simple sugar transport system permease protein
VTDLWKRIDWAKLWPQLIAPAAALVIAAAISSIFLLLSGKDPWLAFTSMGQYGTTPDVEVQILNNATYFYIAAVASAIGFKMGLFNIGTEGQSQIGVFFAGSLATASFLGWLPGALRIVMIIVVAMAVGALWALIAAVLKTRRGVSEVISTLMLNAIAGSVIAWLLNEVWGKQAKGAQIKTTGTLPKDSWMPSIPLIPGANSGVFGFIVIAVALGVAYWFVLSRTRFGFDLRATGYSPSAAAASGVKANRMIIVVMLISGAVAGLILLPDLLGDTHAYTQGFGGIGFTGIAVALMGRNHPVGMALAALLWGFLAQSQQVLDLNDIPKQIVLIMQSLAVLAVVIAYEQANRIGQRAQQRRVGAATADPAPSTTTEVTA